MGFKKMKFVSAIIILGNIFLLGVRGSDEDTDSVVIEARPQTQGFDQPSFVLSVEDEGRHVCSGVIVSDSWALTSAHCVYHSEPGEIQVRSGSWLAESGGRLHRLAEVLIHPEFDGSWENDNDLAMLRIQDSFSRDGATGRPVPLAHLLPIPGSLATVSGYGVDQVLTNARVPIVSHSDCKEDYDFIDGPSTDRVLCAGYRDHRQIDANKEAGSPLVFRGELLGVGMSVNNDGTTVANLYTNLLNVNIRAWIFQNTSVRSLL